MLSRVLIINPVIKEKRKDRKKRKKEGENEREKERNTAAWGEPIVALECGRVRAAALAAVDAAPRD